MGQKYQLYYYNYKTKNDYHQQVFYDAFTDNFIDIEFKKGYWAAEYLNRSLIKISDKEIEEIKQEFYRPKITEECGTFPPNITGIRQDGSSIYSKEFLGIPMEEARLFYVDPVEEKTQEENLLDKYEHQVIKLSKPRTKNKLIIL